MPGRWRRRQRGVNKPLLVDAVAELMPAEVPRLPKRGFGLLQARWMTGSLREEFEHHLATLRTSGLVEADAVDAVWQDFLADAGGPTWSRAWMLGVLGAWLDARRAA
jgi:asparagine synthase (glutamine-hydrolysing)